MNIIPEIETQSPAEIRIFQEAKLRELLLYLNHHSVFYQKHFAHHGISADRIKTLDDLVKIPPTTKDDLQNHHLEFLCVPPTEILEYTSTSGTLGKPVTIALTRNDLERLAYNECISFQCADCTSDDLFQLMLTLDRQFMAGIAYYQGIHKLGAGLIRTGPGAPILQWETIHQLMPTATVAVPSFLLKMIEFAEERGIDPNKSSIRKAICIGESIRNADFGLNTLGRKITEGWQIQLYSTYASTEMQTAFTECGRGTGGHHHPELLIVEVLDEQHNQVPPGMNGEITITTLGVEGIPLLRYKTGDIASYDDDACACGRTTMRMGPVVGRKKQMIKLKGTTFYPAAVFDILNEISAIANYSVEVYKNELGTDELVVHLDVEEQQKPGVESSLQYIFRSRLRVIPQIRFASRQEIEMLQSGTGRKTVKFLDRRG